ncbi:MAG TPA: ABC transporter permease [Candidatus Eisenbacteria bacterium]|uniref:ABC transporter permease n=1 Tax=Eiseniibacteriota bacterium TaxID=2212470 RepID=A0A7V2AW84_UNCEI|nr:ABC transporter permease [Candidatus Eisenbacteria bacterium]
MIAFVSRRIAQSFVLVLIVLTITFFLLKLAPGDPMARYYHPDIAPETVELMRERLGLDRPLHEQYARWIWSFIKGDFGVSLAYDTPVSSLLADAIPNTLRLTVAALLLHILVGVALGIASAARRYSLFDRINTVAALFVYSIPSFWLALMLILLFSLRLGILPSSHMQSIGAEEMGWFSLFVDRLKHLIMPTFVLGIASAASTARYMRGSMIDVLREDYIRTARAKGLPEGAVMIKHAFKNAALPIVTITGLSLPFLLGGAVVIEKIFSWPGMGRLAVDAIYARDYPIVLAVNFVVACMVIAGNLLADIGYALLDPRVTVTGRRS